VQEKGESLMAGGSFDAKNLANMDKEYIWHPFTQMQQYNREEPLIIARGEGSYLYDVQGNKYLDGVSSIWVTLHGHANPKINQALKDQLDLVAHSTLLGQANIPSILLAEGLVKITPGGLDKVFYSDDGSTATEAALKIAFQYWQQAGETTRKKTKFISLKEGYHGDTIGSVSLGGVDLFHAIFRPLLFEGFKVQVPYCYRCPLGLNEESCRLVCTVQVEEILKSHCQEIAAIILEPEMLCAGGMLGLPRGYLAAIRKLSTKYNVLLILDEVAVGFGRTGKMFACEHEQVVPDILCLSKGITGGYLPLGATITNREIYEAFLGEPEEHKKFTHGHSYTGNQLCCTAALANLRIFEEEQVIDNLQPKIQLLANLLEPFRELEQVGDIRQRGLMVGIELVKDKYTKNPFPYEAQAGYRVIRAARKRGLLLRPIVDVIEIVPHLSVTADELEFICTNALAAIAEAVG
jgi:adenosylmethionine-8-amino-7-oxononanoate aminotransferase